MQVNSITLEKRSGTFVDNLKLPVHRWFRYPAGFSAQWVESVIKRFNSTSIVDPFVGSGTTLIASDAMGVKSVGFESHIFVKRIAEAKLEWDIDENILLNLVSILINDAKKIKLSNIDKRSNDKLLGKMYTEEVLNDLERLRIAYLRLSKIYNNKEIKLLWLGITNILRASSHAGTAQWQYVLPNKRKNGAKPPFQAFNEFIDKVIEDINIVRMYNWKRNSKIVLHDVREPLSGNEIYDLLITSPPYPNNYDYADSTRLEMTFWKEIEGWKDLQSVVRKDLIRSCSQHSAAEKLKLNELLKDDLIKPIVYDLSIVCEKLSEIRLTKGGRKSYHTMIAAYFIDLAKIFHNLRNKMMKDSTMCFVIGDSAPYGIHVPVEKWLGELSLDAGFNFFQFEKLRDRNIKWDNRVHKVPLHEGRLWIKG